jgi:adenylate kinase
MEAGELVSDEIVTGILSARLDEPDVAQGFILDGYPRTATQAESLDTLLGQKGMTLHHVIELEVNEEALVDRITGRFTCAKCAEGYHDRYKLPRLPGICDVCGADQFKRRADDNEETVRQRMAEYRAKTAPILPFYEARGLVKRVDGMAPIEEVSAGIEAILAG